MAFALLSLKWRYPGERGGMGWGREHVQVLGSWMCQRHEAQGPVGPCPPGRAESSGHWLLSASRPLL